MKISRLTTLLVAAVAIFVLVLAPTVSAQEAAPVDQHSGIPDDEVLGEEVEVDEVSQAPQAGASTLPVTGGDVAGMATVISVVLIAGTVLVLASRRRADA